MFSKKLQKCFRKFKTDLQLASEKLDAHPWQTSMFCSQETLYFAYRAGCFSIWHDLLCQFHFKRRKILRKADAVIDTYVSCEENDHEQTFLQLLPKSSNEWNRTKEQHWNIKRLGRSSSRANSLVSEILFPSLWARLDGTAAGTKYPCEGMCKTKSVENKVCFVLPPLINSTVLPGKHKRMKAKLPLAPLLASKGQTLWKLFVEQSVNNCEWIYCKINLISRIMHMKFQQCQLLECLSSSLIVAPTLDRAVGALSLPAKFGCSFSRPYYIGEQ